LRLTRGWRPGGANGILRGLCVETSGACAHIAAWKVSPVTREDRWGALVNAAFAIDEAGASGAPSQRAMAAERLDSTLEIFPAGTDPVEDFEGYAVRRLLLALRPLLLASPDTGRDRET